MIHTYRHLTKDLNITADVCIIGSGAGGSAAAFALSRKGLRVVVLEAGSFQTPRNFSQREDDMFPKLFYDAGGRRTRDRAIRILHGHGVGGSTLHNINLCKRPPESLINGWNLKHLTPSTLRPYIEEIESRLSVAPIEEARVNVANRLFRKGTEALGYQGGTLHHNRQGCAGSGFCELGCAFDAKMNALKVLIPEAVHAGAEVYANCRVATLAWNGRRVHQAEALVFAPGEDSPQARLIVEAKIFVCAGGAIETPALLIRSSVPDPYRLIGSRLHLHPGAVVAGVFDQKVEAWHGIPQSFECTEFLSFDAKEDKRIWIVGGSAHPAGAASLLPGFGAQHAGMMQRFPHYLPLSAMVHDLSSGTVSPSGATGVRVDYKMNSEDRTQMVRGLKGCSRILFAAGARSVLIPFANPVEVSNVQELDHLPFEIHDNDLDIVSVHPMSTVWMGDSPENSCADSQGRFHQLDNLWVADTSVYPTSLGIPPQITTYAIGLYVAENLAITKSPTLNQ
ncbi:GMC family oxidoreductase [Bdellovibrionota bacterium FG-1]